MSLTVSDLAVNIRYLRVCECSHMLPYFFPQWVLLSPSLCKCVCEWVCMQCLSDLGQVLLMWREQSLPVDVVMTQRTVPSAHSQQWFSHARNSCTFTHAHTHIHMHARTTMLLWHTYAIVIKCYGKKQIFHMQAVQIKARKVQKYRSKINTVRC